MVHENIDVGSSTPFEATETSEDLRVILEDGYAECMGDGLFILFQEVEGEAQSVVLSRRDLVRLLNAKA